MRRERVNIKPSEFGLNCIRENSFSDPCSYMFFCFHSVVFRVWDSLCTNAPLPSVHRLRVGEITEKWNQYRSTHVSLKKKTIWKRNSLNRLVVSWCSGSQPRFTWSLGQGRMERKKKQSSKLHNKCMNILCSFRTSNKAISNNYLCMILLKQLKLIQNLYRN